LVWANFSLANLIGKRMPVRSHFDQGAPIRFVGPFSQPPALHSLFFVF
jgi:hypothetical protein